MIGATGRVNIQTRTIREGMKVFRRMMATALADEVVRHAKDNVTPWHGPGPHPHRPATVYPPHYDTGFLQDSIGRQMTVDKAKETRVTVFSNLSHERPFNIYLELGWINPDFNTFHRYPFMVPAMLKVEEEYPGNVREAIEKGVAALATNVFSNVKRGF